MWQFTMQSIPCCAMGRRTEYGRKAELGDLAFGERAWTRGIKKKELPTEKDYSVQGRTRVEIDDAGQEAEAAAKKDEIQTRN